MRKTCTIFIALALCSCAESQRFPVKSASVAPVTQVMPVKAPDRRLVHQKGEPITAQPCISLACKTLCSRYNIAHKPKWCTYFRKPD